MARKQRVKVIGISFGEYWFCVERKMQIDTILHIYLFQLKAFFLAKFIA